MRLGSIKVTVLKSTRSSLYRRPSSTVKRVVEHHVEKIVLMHYLNENTKKKKCHLVECNQASAAGNLRVLLAGNWISSMVEVLDGKITHSLKKNKDANELELQLAQR